MWCGVVWCAGGRRGWLYRRASASRVADSVRTMYMHRMYCVTCYGYLESICTSDLGYLHEPGAATTYRDRVSS